MYDDIRTNTGYKYNWLERNLGTIIFISLIGILMLITFNWDMDRKDRRNFCNSILPIEGYDNYKNNKLENEYCYTHINSYNYTDRYFDIPPREYK